VAGYSHQGDIDGYDFAVARLTAAGQMDTSFCTTGKRTMDFGSFFESAQSVVVQADGRPVVAGWSYQDQTGEDFAVARLTGAGQLDTSFSTDGLVTTDFGSSGEVVLDDEAWAVAVRTDGKIVAAGASYGAGAGVVAVARYLGDDLFSHDG